MQTNRSNIKSLCVTSKTCVFLSLCTCSSSCLSRCSCDSSCLLWSSSICIRASSRPLCCRSSLASAISSASRALCGDTGSISGGDGSGDRPFLSWAFFRRSYSDCSFLLGQKGAGSLLSVTMEVKYQRVGEGEPLFDCLRGGGRCSTQCETGE